MTAQISDGFIYMGKQFAIAGISGQGLVDPPEHGLRVRGMCSACWRGFCCVYRLDGQDLVLESMEVWLEEEQGAEAEAGRGPVFMGSLPRPTEGMFNWEYRPQRGVVPFTGGLLLGDEFIEELYVHMGFHPAWKFREVHELIFEAGRLTQACDRSAEMARLREDIDPGALRPKRDVGEWIRRCFSLDYRW